MSDIRQWPNSWEYLQRWIAEIGKWNPNSWEYARQWMREFGKLLYIEAYELYDCECPECPSGGQHAGRHNSYHALIMEDRENIDYLIETLIGRVDPAWDDFEYTYVWVEPVDPVSVWEYDEEG